MKLKFKCKRIRFVLIVVTTLLTWSVFWRTRSVGWKRHGSKISTARKREFFAPHKFVSCSCKERTAAKSHKKCNRFVPQKLVIEQFMCLLGVLKIIITYMESGDCHLICDFHDGQLWQQHPFVYVTWTLKTLLWYQSLTNIMLFRIKIFWESPPLQVMGVWTSPNFREMVGVVWGKG